MTSTTRGIKQLSLSTSTHENWFDQYRTGMTTQVIHRDKDMYRISDMYESRQINVLSRMTSA